MSATQALACIRPPSSRCADFVNLPRTAWRPTASSVDTFAPGIVRTPMMADLARQVARDAGKPEDQGWRPFTHGIALGRISEPSDVAGVVSFLAGPDSDYITGQSIIVDGGMVFN